MERPTRPGPPPRPPGPPPQPPRPEPQPPRPQPEPPRPQPRPPRPQPPRRCPQEYRQISVGYGQDFTSILRQYNVSYGAMTTANPNVNPSNLMPGQRLCVPPWGTHTICTGNRTYTVRQGESLDSLSRSLNASTASILRTNPSMAPDDFTPGQIICRP